MSSSTRTPRPTPRTARAAVTSRGSAAAAVAHERAPRQAKPEPVSLGLVPRTRSRRAVRLFITVSCAVVFASLLGLAAFHSVLVQSQLGLDRLNAEIATELENQAKLRLEVAHLTAPERIVRAAVEQGMVPPANRKFLAAVVPGGVVPPPVTTKPVAPKAATTTVAAVTGAGR